MFVTPVQFIFAARLGAQITPDKLPDIIDEENIPIHKLWPLDTVRIDPKDQNEDQMTQE